MDSGGESLMVRATEGQIGVCKLDRGEIEEWTLFRSSINMEQLAVKVYLAHPHIKAQKTLPNPASIYCHQVGGSSLPVGGPQGSFGLCYFPDKSAIEEWTLFNGPDSNGNERLTSLLRK